MIDKISNKGLKIDIQSLNKLKKSVSNNFEEINNVAYILENLPFLKNDIENRIKNGMLFQPGRITETLIVQVIANHLVCVYISDGIYENELYHIKQDGGSGMSDVIITDKINDIVYIFEIKEPVAYGKSCGFTYDDNGKPEFFTSKDLKYKEYSKSLFDIGGELEHYNILENQGHNKIFNIDDIITNKFDYIISYDSSGNLIFMTIEEYKNLFSFRIEVRSCGRNTRKVFTKNKLNLIDDILFLNEEDIVDIKSRGNSAGSSRYKYISNGATFSFKKNHVFIKDGRKAVNFKNIKQHVGEISIQHFIKIDLQS